MIFRGSGQEDGKFLIYLLGGGGGGGVSKTIV